MSPSSRQPLERTSVHLTRQIIEALDNFSPTLNRSEALRLIIDRYRYLEHAASPQAYELFFRNRTLFLAALTDLACDQFKLVASTLPKLAKEAMEKRSVRDALEKQHRHHPTTEIDWKKIEPEIEALSPVARMYLLDLAVEEHAKEEGRDR